MYCEHCGQDRIWTGLRPLCQTSLGTDLAGNLGAEKNQVQRVGDGMVNERRSRYQ